ncbi:MAG TPA: hypothetical protein PKM43_07745 [Verrucomicrobiota bacterium]|nr:hypothetical protein [Verrucomicrobiota bacterium]
MSSHTPRSLRWLPLLAGLLMAGGLVQAAEAIQKVSTLAQAIARLTADYGDLYPAGQRHAERLDAIRQALEAAPPGSSTAAEAELETLEREALLAHPLLDAHPLLFVVRRQYARDHHNTATFFPKAKTEFNDGAFAGGGALRLLDRKTGGRLTTLVELPEGIVRDPDVDYDGQRIVFALRRNAEDSYHIWQIRPDGTGLKQLTFAEDVDDLDPVCLPDGGIAFSSTREPKYCMCNRHIMANLYRMEADGSNIHQIGKSTLFEGHPVVMPDGRLLYDRWEYVDRNFGDAQALWTVNPDGSNHAIYWGNNTPSPGAVIDGRPIPGTAQVLCVFGSCHDRPWGALAIIDRRLGLDGRQAVVRTWPPEAIDLVKDQGWELFDTFSQVRLKYEDPYPLDAHFFLCARMTGEGEQTAICLVDLFGNEILVHTEAPGCFDPIPLAPRARPARVGDRRDFARADGTLYVANVAVGTHMTGVKPGAARFLRVIESPEKRTWTIPAWNGQGQEAPAMNWHDFNNKRILGTVPIESDGSAHFALPADTFVYFQVLDERGMLIQSMRSGTMVQPGERASCIGCHEDRRQTPPSTQPARSIALQRAPSPLTGWHGPPRPFNYLTEVQPVWDRHCVRCHDFGTEGGSKLNLAGDRDLVFNASYNELWRKKWIQAVGAGPAETLPAYAWGSHRSRLLEYLDTAHHEVNLSPEEFDRVVTWIDLNAPYYPLYASAHPRNLAGRSPLDDRQLARLEQLTGVPLRSLAAHNSNRGPQVSFDRPPLSPCLSGIGLLDYPKRQEALALIQDGRALLLERPGADQPGFVACEADRSREELYQTRRQMEQRHRTAMREGRRIYDTVPTISSP